MNDIVLAFLLTQSDVIQVLCW